MTPQPIIIDADPGDDDAIAILLALASPELEVLGITTVAGNVPLPLTTRNALAMLELAGRAEIPVAPGADRPLLRELLTAEEVHGDNGLGGVVLPEPAVGPVDRHAADFIVETVAAHPPGTVTLCCLGPLTNAALALARAPRLAADLDGIVLMGGSWFQGGNTTPVAEFNIHVDPHAAERVLSSGADVTIVPLDCTHGALITPDRVAAVRAAGTRICGVAADILDFYKRYDSEKYGLPGGPLHDPCVIARLVRPDLFLAKRVAVAVETGSELTMGLTVMDWWGVTGRPANATVLHGVDADGFFALLGERLARL